MTAKLKKLLLKSLLLITAALVFLGAKHVKEDSSKNLAVKDAYQKADKTPVYIYIKKADTIFGEFGVLPATSINDSNDIKLLGRRIDWFMEQDSIDYRYLNCTFIPESLINLGIYRGGVYLIEKYISSDSSFVLCSQYDTVCWEKTSFIVDKRCVHKDSVPEKYIKIVEDFWYNNKSEQEKIYYKLRPHLLKRDKGEKYGLRCVCKHKWKEFWE